MLLQHNETETLTSKTKMTKLIFNPIIGGFGLVFVIISLAQAFSHPMGIASNLRNDCYKHMSEKIAAREKAHPGHGIVDGYTVELHSRCD